MRKTLFILSLFPLLTFGQNQFCENLNTENFTELSNQINTYFINNNSDSLGQNKINLKFTEIDSLINYLSGLEFIDTAHYRHKGGGIMKTAILMTDIIISTDFQGIKGNYIIRLLCDNYTKVVFFRKWEE